jgi:hypothetical protein
MQLPRPPDAPQAPPALEQMFEDTGRLRFTRCRRTAATHAGSASKPSEPPGRLADCPPGFAREP